MAGKNLASRFELKALVRESEKAGDVKLQDIPEPSPSAGQVKIRVSYAGNCGSDASFMERDMAPVTGRTSPW